VSFFAKGSGKKRLFAREFRRKIVSGEDSTLVSDEISNRGTLSRFESRKEIPGLGSPRTKSSDSWVQENGAHPKRRKTPENGGNAGCTAQRPDVTCARMGVSCRARRRWKGRGFSSTRSTWAFFHIPHIAKASWSGTRWSGREALSRKLCEKSVLE